MGGWRDVDHALLLALVRDELPERTGREVHRWVILFKSWSDAYCDLVVREYHAAGIRSVSGKLSAIVSTPSSV
jgi:hypothetical protein